MFTELQRPQAVLLRRRVPHSDRCLWVSGADLGPHHPNPGLRETQQVRPRADCYPLVI